MLKPLAAQTIAEMIGGSLHGNSAAMIERIAPLDSAGPGDLTFFDPSAKRRQAEMRRLAQGSTAAVILTGEYDPEITATQIVIKNPLGALIRIASQIHHPPRPAVGTHPTAVIHETAEIGPDAAVGPYVVVGENCRIGAGVVLHAHVVVYAGAEIGEGTVVHSGAVIREHVVLGKDCLIQNGAIVGSDGFGYLPDKELGQRRIPHIGRVVLEDSVDIGANAAVDRATFGETRLGQAAKVDNLVQIGHNNKIGRRALLCGQVGVSGSCSIGDDVILGGQVGVADHIEIGSRSRVGAQSGISNDVPEGVDLMGTPAVAAAEHWRHQAAVRRLPELIRQVREQEKRLKSLEAKLLGEETDSEQQR